MKVSKYTSSSIEGTFMMFGVETAFTAGIDGKVALTLSGPSGFAVLDFIRNLEGGDGEVIVGAGATPPSAEAAKRGRKPKEAAAPAAQPPSAPAAPTTQPGSPAVSPPDQTPPVALPDPKVQPHLPGVEPPAAEPAAEEDPSAYIDTPASKTDQQAKVEAALAAASVKAPAPTPAPAPAPAAVAAAAPGTAPYVDPSADFGGLPAEIVEIGDWQALLPAISVWACKQTQVMPGVTTLDIALDKVVATVAGVLPKLPISKGAQAQNFAPNVLKVMLRKHVQNFLAAA